MGERMTDQALVPMALLDGVASPLAETRVPVTDAGFARGDGVFETIGVWGGRCFALAAHLERLARSLELAHLEPVDLRRLEQEAISLVDGVEADAALRIYITASGTRLLTVDVPPARPLPHHLVVQPAPWIAPPDTEPGAPKTMSYLPNMAASRAARQAGGDDALLITAGGIVLEGATFSVFWVRDGAVHVPDLDLGIIDSISRRTVLGLAGEQGLDVRTGRWPVAALLGASEVLAVSSLRDLTAVRRIGDSVLPSTDRPVLASLSAALRAARRGV